MTLTANVLDENRRLSDLLKNQDKEIEKLRDLLRQCIPAAQFAKDLGLVSMIKDAIGENVTNNVTNINLQHY